MRLVYAGALLALCSSLPSLLNYAAHGQEAVAPSLSGIVTGPDARPVTQAQVTLRQTGAGMALPVMSGPDGSYAFRALRTGVDYELSAEKEGLASPTVPLRVSAPDEKVNIGLKLLPAIQFE